MQTDIQRLREKVKAIESGGHSLEQQEQNNLCHKSQSVDHLAQSEIVRRICWSAMEHLSRREHSVRELNNKLKRRYPDNSVEIENCIQSMMDKGLQSDQRFCEAYVAMRKRKGYGPQRVLAELREKGVTEDLAKAEVLASQLDWYAAAFEVWQKKFRGVTPQDAKERAKQIRFLSYRGFSQSHINEIYSQI